MFNHIVYTTNNQRCVQAGYMCYWQTRVDIVIVVHNYYVNDQREVFCTSICIIVVECVFGLAAGGGGERAIQPR